MYQIDDQEDIDSDEEIDNVDAEPLNADRNYGDVNTIKLDVYGPNSDNNFLYSLCKNKTYLN